MDTMTPELLKECTKIIEILINSELSDLFVDPIYNDNEEYANYTDIIENPQFFKPIQQKLLKGDYQTFSQFENDVNLVFSNTYKYFGKDSYISIIATELSKKFQKLARNITCNFSNEAWISEITRIFSKLTTELKMSPASLKNKLSIESFTDAIPPKEISKFSKAANHLKSADDVLGMLQILNAGGIPIDPSKDHLYINLKSIPSEVILPLMAYTKKRYNDMQLKYPA